MAGAATVEITNDFDVRPGAVALKRISPGT
ncbi:MAG: hypothetical protein RLZZ282_1288, partial [Verrucomicrobiota bacterium]